MISKSKLRRNNPYINTPIIQSPETSNIVPETTNAINIIDDTSHNSNDILIKNFDMMYENVKLLTGAELKIISKKKYGIIGHNGVGKSTLLKHIADRKIYVNEHLKILYVEQEEIPVGLLTAYDVLLAADTERLELIERRKLLEENIDKLSEDIDTDADGFEIAEELAETERRLKSNVMIMTAEKRAAAILSGLQFTDKMIVQPVVEFSGGWRMRISLAKALFINPDILILDEPTNHLDINACIWLENYLSRYTGTLLLVSHDIEFLNMTVDNIICFRNNKLEYYPGNYDSYENIMKKITETERTAWTKQQKLIKELKKSKTPQAKTKLLAMQKTGLLCEPKMYRVKFSFDHNIYIPGNLIEINNIGFGYDRLLFDNFTANIDCNSRIAIVGPNGIGKSTLMNILCADIEVKTGEVIVHKNTKIAKLSQHFINQLDMNVTPIEFIMEKTGSKEEAVRILCKFNLKFATLNLPIGKLSGGQKCRVALCNMAIDKPNLLMLDEPTNHLDIKSVNSLISALEGFPGAIVVITHDQRLVTSLANRLWIFKKNKPIRERYIDPVNYTFDTYVNSITKHISAELF